ncbi:NADH-quinone oxidoreductase subunit NuoE family protein [Oceanirhabdus sp. W0125-5]|uniref:NADH-quinone oxidoreductase subunit NuoE family protein n=1 Tax=Oceanirhabdus sp. W0125-5 TaxID=2999116 RepID=UPI0022F2AE4E|nr:NAD(P)H-dependent oxidoreductase subunit E [Oceanirhabdus sp. W0125-5]WBW99224.1 NAD(P)H-dependent oxidoreductase subunit E [Oceanirhabdus sp. W0125-5]
MSDFIFNEELMLKIDSILEENDYSELKLLSILLQVQEIIPGNFIPEVITKYISKKISVPLSKTYEVITFFEALSTEPKGKIIIQVCKSPVCTVKKFETILEPLQNELGISVGETTEDGLFTLQYSSCFGACDISPAIRINNEVHGNLTKDKIKDIINSYRRKFQ